MKNILIAIFLFYAYVLSSQSLQHPVIWVTAEERGAILEIVEKYDWAKSIVDQLHVHVDSTLDRHLLSPNDILTIIPEFAKNDHENREQQAGPLAHGHNKVLSLAANAGILFYLTEDEKYAQFAADILAFYIDVLAPRTPQTTSICGYAFFDPRTTYGPFAIAYDFIYDYLIRPDTKVYSIDRQRYISFDNENAQKALRNMAGNVLQEYGAPDHHGKTISNHPILTAPGALYTILCIQDDEERERLFNVFWEKGTAHQNSFKHTILPMFSGQGIWPESLSYSFMPIITMVLNIVDRIKPEMDVTSEYNHVFQGNFLFDYLRYPNRAFVRYGDSKRYNDFTGALYRYTLSIADRRGYQSLKQKAQVALQQSYQAAGGYKPNLKTGHIFNNYGPLELFWGLPLPDDIDDTVDLDKPTVIIDHAGVALQRNYVKDQNILYGLCGIIGGAHYVHSHLTGIAMELYGADYVMGPNAGLPPTVKERQIPLHEHYFRLYAGNNTVVVNGTSHGLDEGSWKGKAHVWQNTVVNIAAEPKHLEDPISQQFSFATQYLNDEVNDCKQERTLSTIRTSDSTAYYLDLFRSVSRDTNLFHDYIYHNIGDTTVLTDAYGEMLKVQKTDRYQTDIGDVVHSPGWRYFEDTQVTNPTDEAVKVRFDINYDHRYMHVHIPGGISREYTTALAPPSREAKNGYLEKKTRTIVVRQSGEAWDRPYLTIFEPTISPDASVQHVEALTDDAKVVGAKVTSTLLDVTITDYIISQDSDTASYYNEDLKLHFDGRFAVVRTIKDDSGTKLILYIGQGERLTFQQEELQTDKDNKAYKELVLD